MGGSEVERRALAVLGGDGVKSLAGVASAVAAHLGRYQHQVAIVQRY